MRLLKILILEDDLLTLSKLFEKLSRLEVRLSEEKGIEFSILVLSEYKQVEKYINKDSSPEFDLVLLDRDCKLGGSFHILDMQKFGPEKILGISSVPEYNEELRKIGVTKIVLKDYQNLDKFSNDVNALIENSL